MKYRNLGTTFLIGKTEIKNRFVVAPMDTGGLYENEYSGISEEGQRYFIERARGGFGLIYSWGMRVDSKVDHFGKTILDNPEDFIKTGKVLNSRLSETGSKMFIQLAFGLGRNMPGALTPSPLPTLGNPDLISTALTEKQIKAKIDSMIEGAKLVKEAGYSGVEIHALHWGHLLDEFGLSFMNHRTDKYGGHLRNRLRVAKELVEGIKKECGKDFPVTIRLGVRSFLRDYGKACFTEDEKAERGRTIEESIEIATLLEEFGYDALNIDTGVIDSFYWCCVPSYISQGYMVEFASRLKEAVNIPILAGSRMQDTNIAEEGISEGKFDAIVLGRPSLADPEIPNKILSDCYSSVRPCIGCNSGCIQKYFTDGYVGCTVNPEMGMSYNDRPVKTEVPKKIVVVGGGVAGMEAARILKTRGHEVILIEKSESLGGNLIPAGQHDFKKEVRQLNEWYINRISQLKVDIRVNTKADAELIKSLSPDVVILAQGSMPVMPKQIKGIDNPKAISCLKALKPDTETGEHIVIVGGGLVGCEMALGYLKKGKKVIIIEMMADILSTGDVPSGNRQYLLDAFQYYGAVIYRNTRLEEITDTGVRITLPNGMTEYIEADNVILSVGFRPVPSLKEDINDIVPEIYLVGDGEKVGSILTAIRQAYDVAIKI